MNNKVIVGTLVIFLISLVIPFVFGFEASSDTHSINSYHMGITGNVIEGADYSGRDTLTYQQPGNDEVESDTVSLNLGWFEKLIAEIEEEIEPTVSRGGTRRVQFDVKVLEFQSPINVGELFNFTYFVKGVGSIGNDVTIDFWIEKNKTIITSGSDVIYMGTNDEITETGSLFLPENISDGTYKFVIRASYGSVHGEAHREIGVTVEEGVATIIRLFDISFLLEDMVITDSDDLIAVLSFENFGNIVTTIDLTFIILDEFGNEIHRDKSEITVVTEKVLRKKFLGIDLPEGDYTFIVETLYDTDVYDEFSHDFTIEAKWGINFLIWIIGIFILLILLILLILFIRWLSKMTKEVWHVKEKYKDKKQKYMERYAVRKERVSERGRLKARRLRTKKKIKNEQRNEKLIKLNAKKKFETEKEQQKQKVRVEKLPKVRGKMFKGDISQARKFRAIAVRRYDMVSGKYVHESLEISKEEFGVAKKKLKLNIKVSKNKIKELSSLIAKFFKVQEKLKIRVDSYKVEVKAAEENLSRLKNELREFISESNRSERLIKEAKENTRKEKKRITEYTDKLEKLKRE